LRWLEPEPKNYKWSNQSLKFEFSFNRHSLWSKPIVQIIQWFLVFNGSNRSGAEPKTLKLESEPEICVPASQPWSHEKLQCHGHVTERKIMLKVRLSLQVICWHPFLVSSQLNSGNHCAYNKAGETASQSVFW